MHANLRSLLLLGWSLLPTLLSALPVDAPTAWRRAAAYMAAGPQAAHGERQAARRLLAAEPPAAERWGCAWLFRHAQGAFVLAAADDALPPVLGYGQTAAGEMPPALQAWRSRKGQALAHSLPAAPKDYPLLATGDPVAPLLTLTRHQEAPYNNLCPYYRMDDGTLSTRRCVVGCVATALEEILTGYRRPVVLIDTLFGWTTNRYDIPDMLPGTRVETSLIRDNYDGEYTAEEAEAVARLSYLCGVAARMNWGLSESGAHVARLEEPLRRALGLPYVHSLDSYKFRPEEWVGILCRELQAGRPVLYTGYVMATGGHAFVVDGFDGQGFFHVNWGYGGYYDGYFRLDLLCFAEPPYDLTSESLPYGFFCNQQALVLSPDPVAEALPDTLKRTGREIAVESIRAMQPPETGKYTQIRLRLRNTSTETLTTPFEFFTNAPTDTALFDQGDYVALSGCTLRPGETATMDVHATFSEAGERILRLSPDDVHLSAEIPLTVESGKPDRLTFGEPKLFFPAAQTLGVALDIANAPEGGRSGGRLVYGLYEGHDERTDGETRHFRHFYLQPGESLRDTVHFRGLKAGQDYTLLVRYPWAPLCTVRFTLPAETGIPSATTDEAETDPGTRTGEWYTPDGRRAPRPRTPGIYLQRDGKRFRKVFVRP